MDKKELDLNNPIFVVYVNIDGLSRARGEELISEYAKNLDIYSNITMWLFPVRTQDTRVELVYSGAQETNKAMSRLVLEINKALDIVANSGDFNDFKNYIRSWRLDQLVCDEEE
jgi:hypothetical protein